MERMTSREELIEKARVAFTEAWDEENRKEWAPPLDYHRRSRAGIVAALAVFEEAHTPINGSCWDQAPMVLPRPGECAPMPPLCELTAGHLGAHRSGTTEWMHSPTHTPEPQGEPSDAEVEEGQGHG